VLAALSDRTAVVVMPGRLWNCGGPAVGRGDRALMQIALRFAPRRRQMMRARPSIRCEHAPVPPYGVLVAGLAILVVILMGRIACDRLRTRSIWCKRSAMS
jgi:hypothetical protein